VSGSLQSLCWGSHALGGILSAYWSGALVHAWGTRAVFGATAALPLIVGVAALLIDEPRVLDASQVPPRPPPGTPHTGPVLGRTTAVSEVQVSPDSALGSSVIKADKVAGEQGSAAAAAVPSEATQGTGFRGRRLNHPLQISDGWNEAANSPPQRKTQLKDGRGEQCDVEGQDEAAEDAPLLRGEDQSAASGSRGGHQRMLSAKGASGCLRGLGRTLSQHLSLLWSTLGQRGVLLPTLFVFVWQATPSAGDAMFYFQTNQLGFDAEFLGRVALVGSLAKLAGRRAPLGWLLGCPGIKTRVEGMGSDASWA
jgi:hypothetical protein